MQYHVIIKKRQNNYVARALDLPGFVSFAKTKAEACRRVGESIGLYLETLTEKGLSPPEPQPYELVRLPIGRKEEDGPEILTELVHALYAAADAHKEVGTALKAYESAASAAHEAQESLDMVEQSRVDDTAQTTYYKDLIGPSDDRGLDDYHDAETWEEYFDVDPALEFIEKLRNANEALTELSRSLEEAQDELDEAFHTLTNALDLAADARKKVWHCSRAMDSSRLHPALFSKNSGSISDKSAIKPSAANQKLSNSEDLPF